MHKKYTYVDMLMRFEAGTAKESGGMNVAVLMSDQNAMADAALDTFPEDEIVLSDKDWDHLMDHMDNPPEPSDRLKAAMSKYREEQCPDQGENQ